MDILNNNPLIIKDLELKIFKDNFFENQSNFFKEIFSDFVRSIEIRKNKLNPNKIEFLANIIFDSKSSNLFGITHGGGIVTVIESLSDISLKYLFDIDCYTTDSNINFLRPTNLNEEYSLLFKIEKMGFKSYYIDVCLNNKKGELNVHASLIKNKMKGKF
jgi:hypothetical protein